MEKLQGETVRRIQDPERVQITDLVFNPTTGEFEQCERGSAPQGSVVTQMAADVFAKTINI